MHLDFDFYHQFFTSLLWMWYSSLASSIQLPVPVDITVDQKCGGSATAKAKDNDPSYPPSNAVDENPSSYWRTIGDIGCGWFYEFSKPRRLSSVEIMFEWRLPGGTIQIFGYNEELNKDDPLTGSLELSSATVKHLVSSRSKKWRIR